MGIAVTQCLKPIATGMFAPPPFRLRTPTLNVHLASMRQFALGKVELPDGTIIPKNSFLVVSGHGMWDSVVYQSSGTWDGYRFYRMRETPGQENLAQLVNTGLNRLGFGLAMLMMGLQIGLA